MPYFVYKILTEDTTTARKLELLQESPEYREAKARVREMRSSQSPDDKSTFKIIFAESEDIAEKQLREIREKPIMKEWEK